MARTFRKVLPTQVPSWLQGGDGGRLIAALAQVLDTLDDRARLGLLMRFPSYAHLVKGALAQLGLSRGLRQGRDETDPHFAARLKRWRFPRGHRVRGSAFALLEQISEYFGGAACWTIDRKGKRSDFAADGSVSWSTGNAWTWDSAPMYPRKNRFWVVANLTGYVVEQLAWDDPLLFGGDWSAPNQCLGMRGVSPNDLVVMRDFVSASGMSWKPAGTMPEWLILAADATEPSPDASWEFWSQIVETVQVPVRDANFRYVSYRPALNNTYGGRVQFCVRSKMPDGTTYGGFASDFATSIPRPGGGTAFTGDSASFPSRVQLPDDGSSST